MWRLIKLLRSCLEGTAGTFVSIPGLSGSTNSWLVSTGASSISIWDGLKIYLTWWVLSNLALTLNLSGRMYRRNGKSHDPKLRTWRQGRRWNMKRNIQDTLIETWFVSPWEAVRFHEIYKPIILSDAALSMVKHSYVRFRLRTTLFDQTLFQPWIGSIPDPQLFTQERWFDVELHSA